MQTTRILTSAGTSRPNFVGRLAMMWKTWRNRRAVADLLAMDDRLLSDIGVSRGDIHEALGCRAVPPGDMLSARASRQRQAEIQRLRAERRDAKAAVTDSAAAGRAA
jgi:uncharacterized protein YjiS (DUF1127 family)